MGKNIEVVPPGLAIHTFLESLPGNFKNIKDIFAFT
jgi:hypothetical protein